MKVRLTSFVLFMEISVVLTAVAKTSQRTCTACWRGRLQLATNWSEARTAERHRESERKVPTCTTVWWDQWPAIPHRKKTKKQNRTKSQDFTIIHQLACTTLCSTAWESGSKIPLCRILEKCSKLSCYCRIRPVNQHFHYFLYGEHWPHFKTINIQSGSEVQSQGNKGHRIYIFQMFLSQHVQSWEDFLPPTVLKSWKHL